MDGLLQFLLLQQGLATLTPRGYGSENRVLPGTQGGTGFSEPPCGYLQLHLGAQVSTWGGMRVARVLTLSDGILRSKGFIHPLQFVP